MTSSIKTSNIIKKNLANDKYNLDGLYELSIISSIILAGFAEATQKCEKYKDNNPLCIPPDEVIYHRQNGGERKLEEIEKRLVDSVNPDINSDAIGNATMLGKFINLAQTVNGKLFNIVENTSNTALGLQNALNNPNIELDVSNFFIQNKEVIKRMTRDPEVQAALREWVEEVSVLNIQLMDMAKPTIDMMVNKTVDTINNAATRAARGVVSTSLNVLEAFLGEIPVAGGIMDLIIAFMRGFNSAMHASAPLIEFTTEAFFRALRTVFTTLAIVKNKGEDIQQAAYKVKGAVENISQGVNIPNPTAILENFERKGKEAGEDYVNSVLEKLPKVPTVEPGKEITDREIEERLAKLKETDKAQKILNVSKGGSNVRRANIQKRINHVTHRLRKTLRKFMRKTKKHSKK